MQWVVLYLVSILYILHQNISFYAYLGSYTCTCLYGYTGDGKTCLPVPDKPEMLKVTELSPSEVRVTWSVTNTSIITHITVEYKGFGIHGSEWEVVILQPQETKTHLTDLETDSTYLVRVGKTCD